MNKDHKRKVLVLATCMAFSKIAPATREQIQHLRNETRLNYQLAAEYLASGHSIDDDRLGELIESAKTYAKKFREYTDEDFKKRLPALNALYLIFPSGTSFVSGVKPKKPEEPKVPIKVHLVTLNALRRVANKKPLGSWRGTHKQILAEIIKVRKQLETPDFKKTNIGITVVAENAYKSDQEALARTGHTMRGKTRSQQKYERRKTSFVEALHPPTATHNLKLTDLKHGKRLQSDVNKVRGKKPIGDTIKLSDIAQELGIEGKVARHKARRYAEQLKKLEVKKYHYAPSSRAAVIAILKADNRKR